MTRGTPALCGYSKRTSTGAEKRGSERWSKNEKSKDFRPRVFCGSKSDRSIFNVVRRFSFRPSVFEVIVACSGRNKHFNKKYTQRKHPIGHPQAKMKLVVVAVVPTNMHSSYCTVLCCTVMYYCIAKSCCCRPFAGSVLTTFEQR